MLSSQLPLRGGALGPWFLGTATVVLLFCFDLAPTSAQVEGVSYTLTPSYNVLRWDEDLGVEDTEMFGGHLALNLGKLMSVQGFYLGRDGLRTNLNLRDANDQAVLDQDLDLRNYGADVILNLGRGRVVPFLKAGGGIMRFSTADGDDTEQINLKLGGGVRYGLQRFKAVAFVEDSALRLDRYDLAPNADTDPAFPEDPEASKNRHNLHVGLGVEFRLGGVSQREELSDVDQAILRRYRAGLTGVSLPVEIYGGKLDFNEDLGLDNQNFLGVRTGADFGQLVGLRAFYWHGISDGLDATDPIRSFGGEAQFNLNTGQGGVPYLLLGAGKLDFTGDYTDPLGMSRDDKTMLIAGGGVGFTVGNRIRIDLSVRDYIFAEQSLDDVAGTDQLVNNWALSAGARFSFGRGGIRPNPGPNVVVDTPATAPAATSTTVPAAASPQAVTVAASEASPADPAASSPTSPTAAAAATGSPESTPAATIPATAASREAVVPEPPATVASAQPTPVVTDFQGQRQVSIPIPTHGEIYIRYGRPGGVQVNSTFQERGTPSPEGSGTAGQVASTSPVPPPTTTAPSLDVGALRDIIRTELESYRREQEKVSSSQQPKPASTLSDEERMELMERRLAQQVTSTLDARLGDLERRLAVRSGDPNTVVVRDGSPATSGAPVVVETGPGRGWKPKGTRTFTGFGVDDPEQVILGGRLDLGPVASGSRLHFVPELSLGFGNDTTSFMVTGELAYTFRRLDRRGDWSPVVGVGAGILGYSNDVESRPGQEGVLNVSYGLAANFGRWTGFAEHQGIDLFDLNRVLMGVRWNFGN